MKTMRLTKMFSFEMAHCLWHYEGKCSNLHGHSYKMEVTVEGLPSQENGMVIDFKKLKDIVNETIIDKFDHSTVLYEHTDSEIINALKKNFERVHILPFQPSTENLLQHFADLLLGVLPDHVKLYSIRLHETDTSYAELFFE